MKKKKLPHHRKGATRFQDLRSINNDILPTFQEVFRVLGLLEDDTEKGRVMEEASAVRFGPQLRSVFLSTC